MQKVSFFDRRVLKRFLEISSGISIATATIAVFLSIPEGYKLGAFGAFLALLALVYVCVWIHSNKLKRVELKVEGSTVEVKEGNIFEQSGFKAIAFNEYFDTLVDDKIIAKNSLNGVFIENHLGGDSVQDLNRHIDDFEFDAADIGDINTERKAGKTQRYRLGTICVYKDFLLTAFSKFDVNSNARLTMPEYLEFLINFWDRVNRVYAQQSVSTPIFGSGITRITGHRGIIDEDLLKIMLWTFRISEMRFKYPARLTIVIDKAKIDQISLLDIKLAKRGL
jgi:hypothetical protein